MYLARPAKTIASPAPLLHTFVSGAVKNPIRFKTQGFMSGQIGLVKSITASISLYLAQHPGNGDVTRYAKTIKTVDGEEDYTLPATMVAIPAHADANAVVGTNIAAPSAPEKVMNVIVLINGVVATRRGQDVADGSLAAGQFKATAADAIRVHAPKGAEIEVFVLPITQATGGALTQHRTYEIGLRTFAFSLGTVEIADAIAR